MSEFIPQLRQLKVSPEKLVVDPNNPRLITHEKDAFDESQALDLMDNTISKMRDPSGKDKYKIKELENSIKENGWWPIDFIFAKKFGSDERYLVLEGNRRVTAIKNLRNNPDTDSELIAELDLIDVMEITDNIPVKSLQKKITYLLGVRHHGSLTKWTPFAQANNIYNRYLEIAKQSTEDFTWDENIGQEVADALSIKIKDVKARLQVYRAMEQLADLREIKESVEKGGGIKDRYYSVCSEVLLSSNRQLRDYIHKDARDFYLDDESLHKMNNLCHFNQPNREESPINNPLEWRKLANILKEENVERKQQMLEEVEVNKRKPSEVWAERAVELQKMVWDKWLKKVHSILKKVTFGDDLSSDTAKNAIKRLIMLVDTLDAKDRK